jgi:hypothetical protein
MLSETCSSPWIELARPQRRARLLPRSSWRRLTERTVLAGQLLGLSACDRAFFRTEPEDLTAPADAPTLTLSISGDPVADRTSVLEISARTSPMTTAASLAGSASAGVFLPSQTATATFPINGTAETVLRLRAPAEGAAVRLRVSVRGTVRDTIIQYRRAFADTVLLQPRDSFTVRGDPGGLIVLTAALRRQTGIVSPGAAVTFDDSLPTGTPKGIFGVAEPTDTLGTFRVIYTPGLVDAAGRGPRQIRACTAGVSGRICATTTIFVR